MTDNLNNSEYLEAGKIVNTHGVRGNVKVESWCDSPQVLAALKKVYFKKKSGEYIPAEVRSAFVHKGYAVMSLSGIDTMDDALRYKNAVIYAEKNDIPRGENEIFICDIIGLPVIDADNGCTYGHVRDYTVGRAQDLYEIELDGMAPDTDGRTRICYIPAVEQFIDRVDTESGVYIRPIEGLIDEI